MPEAVCVTVEQLKQLERLTHDPNCHVYQCCGCDCSAPSGWCNCDSGKSGREIVNPILAQAERLKDWKPEVGDWVRLKATPEAGPFVVHSVDSTGIVQLLTTGHVMRKFGWRYVAELMPEEGE